MKKILPLIILLSCSSPKVEDQIQLKKDCIDCVTDSVNNNTLDYTDSLIMANDSLMIKIHDL